MIGFRTSLFSCLVLACSVTSAGARDANIASRAKAKALQESFQCQPMIFFVAKGGPNACDTPGSCERILRGQSDHPGGRNGRQGISDQQPSNIVCRQWGCDVVDL